MMRMIAIQPHRMFALPAALLRVVACLLAFATVLGAVALPAQAQARDFGIVGETINVCVARAGPGVDARALAEGRIPVDCATPQSRFGKGDYWLVSQPLAADVSGQRLAVRSLSVWQDRMTIHALFDDGTMQVVPIDDHDVTARLQLGGLIETWIDRKPARLTRLVWHVEGAQNLRGIIIAPRLAKSVEVAVSSTMLAALYAGLGGLITALLLYNLGLARAMKQAFLPPYCLMMAGLLFYLLTSSGAFAWLFPLEQNTLRLRLNYVGLAIIGVAVSSFLIRFFEDGIVRPWMAGIMYAASITITVTSVWIALFAPLGLKAAETLFSLGFLLFLCGILPILISAWVKRSEYFGVFMLAWSGPIAFTVLRTAYNLGFTSHSFWVDNSTLLAMAFEAVLSSAAIARRILIVTRERDEARAQELVARALADTDPLTGLLNRRAFLRDAIGRQGDQQLLILDIDHFKGINETIGHDGGDEVLRIVARTMRTAAPQGALVARIGGEEFAMLIDAGDAIEAEAVLAKLRSQRMPFDLSVTASIGQCLGPIARETDWKQLYRWADSALFEAKAGGRDRTAIARPPAWQLSTAA